MAAVLFQGASRGLQEFSHTSKGPGHQLTHNSQDLVRVRLAVSRSEGEGPASVAKRRAWRETSWNVGGSRRAGGYRGITEG